MIDTLDREIPVVPRDDLDTAVRATAAAVAAKAPLAVRAIKRNIDAYADRGMADALDRAALAAALTLTSDDAHEGYTARAARRPPGFAGR